MKKIKDASCSRMPRPAWLVNPAPVTEDRNHWRAERFLDLSMSSDALRRAIDALSPSNAELRRRASEPPAHPPQSWYDESTNPFEPDSE